MEPLSPLTNASLEFEALDWLLEPFATGLSDTPELPPPTDGQGPSDWEAALDASQGW
jgi:hypothetical protein